MEEIREVVKEIIHTTREVAFSEIKNAVLKSDMPFKYQDMMFEIIRRLQFDDTES